MKASVWLVLIVLASIAAAVLANPDNVVNVLVK